MTDAYIRRHCKFDSCSNHWFLWDNFTWLLKETWNEDQDKEEITEKDQTNTLSLERSKGKIKLLPFGKSGVGVVLVSMSLISTSSYMWNATNNALIYNCCPEYV